MVYSLFDGDILSYFMEDVNNYFRLSYMRYSVGNGGRGRRGEVRTFLEDRKGLFKVTSL
jgi:hypothetical protein